MNQDVPITYCRKKVKKNTIHYAKLHKVDSLCFLLMDHPSKDQCIQLLFNIRTVLPDNIEELVKSYRSKVMEVNGSTSNNRPEGIKKSHDITFESPVIEVNGSTSNNWTERIKKSHDITFECPVIEVNGSTSNNWPEGIKKSHDITFECPWSYINGKDRCTTKFSISSFAGVQILSKHIHHHYISSSSTQSTVSEEFKKQLKVLDNLYGVLRVRCPLPYCKKEFVSGLNKEDHYIYEHKVETLCLFLLGQEWLLNGLKQFLPQHIQDLVKSYRSKLLESQKGNLIESMKIRFHKSIENKDKTPASSCSEQTTRTENKIRSHECPWSFIHQSQKCPKNFTISSLMDVLNLSDHIFHHFDAAPRAQLHLFNKQLIALDKMSNDSGHEQSLKCPITYCKKKMTLEGGRFRHYCLEHKIEALCLLLVDHKCVKLLESISAFLPSYYEDFVRKYDRWGILEYKIFQLKGSTVYETMTLHSGIEPGAENTNQVEIGIDDPSETSEKNYILDTGDQNQIEVTDAATKLLQEKAFRCITCSTNETGDLCGLHGIKVHISQSKMISHDIKCIPCNEVYTIRKGSKHEYFLHVHGLSRNHVLNVMRKKKWKINTPISNISKPITHFCEVCQKNYKDHYFHISSQIHSFNAKLLLAFLDYCHLRNLYNLGEENFGLRKEEIVFFFKTLQCFLPATMETRKKLCEILKEYIGYVIDESRGPNSRVSMFKDWLDPVADAMLRQSSLPSSAMGVCFSCNQIFTTFKSIEKHLVSQMHKSLSKNNYSPIFKCLKCEYFIPLIKYLGKRHVQNCIEKIEENVLQKSEEGENKNVTETAKKESLKNFDSFGEDESDLEVQEILTSTSRNDEAQITNSDFEASDDGVMEVDIVTGTETFSSFDDVWTASTNSSTSEDHKQHKDEGGNSSENATEYPPQKEILSSTFNNTSVLETEIFNNFDDVFSVSSKDSRKRKQDKDILSFSEEKESRRIDNNSHFSLKNDEEYYYFCLDCENHVSKKTCNHLKHSRVPIGMDITNHLKRTGHENFEPISNFVLPIKQNKMLRIKNISYSKEWGDRVRKCYKKLILSAAIEDDRYETPRACLRCGVEISCATDMYLHLKTHL